MILLGVLFVVLSVDFSLVFDILVVDVSVLRRLDIGKGFYFVLVFELVSELVSVFGHFFLVVEDLDFFGDILGVIEDQHFSIQ